MRKMMLAALAALGLVGCGQSFSQKDYGEDWPFTVEKVSVGCDAMGLPFVEADRRTYGLTGHAVQQGYPPVAPIHIQGKSIGPFIEAALAKCRK